MPEKRQYTIQVLGRTLEHLGAQMYKRRDTAIAELVANSWDAGATNVLIDVPTSAAYSPENSKIIVEDDGGGMSADEVQSDYLVVGRNRRAAGRSDNPVRGRRIMGRKGIGKLAGFGIASRMRITTWTEDGGATTFVLDIDLLKTDSTPGQPVEPVPIDATINESPPPGTGHSGTKLVLTALKHSTPIDIAALRESLARRFSRTTRGSMSITVNGLAVEDPNIEFNLRIPEDGGFEEHELSDGSTVRYYYGFSRSPLQSSLMRGFGVYVNDKIAQAPPFFFGVEGTASGQHGTRYLNGEIHADFLDAGDDDGSDIISTDRQEIDWEARTAADLKAWGAELTRRALRDWAGRNGKRTENRILSNAEFKKRIENLEPEARKKVSAYLRTLGQAGPEDDEKTDVLADSLIRAFEYRHFHDVVGDIEQIEDDADRLRDLVQRLADWKVLESRAILEVIRGRLAIIDRFNKSLVENYPETAPRIGSENLHDLIAWYPWLIDPEWQILDEEKVVSKQLWDLGYRDIPLEDRGRYDFLGLSGDGRLKVIEIKRAGYSVSLEDMNRLVSYAFKLNSATEKIDMVFISGDNYDFELDKYWNNNITRYTWAGVHERVKAYYEHYRSLLESDVEDPTFSSKQQEVKQTRRVLEVGPYRTPTERRAGLGPQDNAFESPLQPASTQERSPSSDVPGSTREDAERPEDSRTPKTKKIVTQRHKRRRSR